MRKTIDNFSPRVALSRPYDQYRNGDASFGLPSSPANEVGAIFPRDNKGFDSCCVGGRGQQTQKKTPLRKSAR